MPLFPALIDPCSLAPRNDKPASGQQIDKNIKRIGIDLGAASLAQPLDGFGVAQRGAVRSVSCHRVISVDDRDDPRADRYLLVAQPIGVAVAIPILVMPMNDRPHLPRK